MTDATAAPAPTPAPEPTNANTASEPELEITPPPGVILDYPKEGSIRVQVQIPLATRLLLRVPRAVILALVVTVLIQAWRHRLFIVFWFFGLPFLRWLRGPRQSSLVIGERSLEVEGAHWFGGTISLPRYGLESVSIGRADALRMWQRTLIARDKDKKQTLLFVGLTPEQAEFLNAGLQRWLAGEG